MLPRGAAIINIYESKESWGWAEKWGIWSSSHICHWIHPVSRTCHQILPQNRIPGVLPPHILFTPTSNMPPSVLAWCSGGSCMVARYVHWWLHCSHSCCICSADGGGLLLTECWFHQQKVPTGLGQWSHLNQWNSKLREDGEFYDIVEGRLFWCWCITVKLVKKKTSYVVHWCFPANGQPLWFISL